MRRRPWIPVFCLAVASASTSAFAQQAPNAEPVLNRAETADEAAGRALFERAVAELEAGQFALAATHFEESLRRNPSPFALFNLAFAYRGLGRYIDAIDAIERFLRDPRTTSADRVGAAQVELERMRSALARVRVTVAPEGATVLVDGRPGQQREGAFVMDPGRRVIEVSRVGYRAERRELTLAQGAREELSVTLSVIDAAGRLRIEPSVAGARVSIDGAFAGAGIVERSATVGVHRVEITAEGYLRFERTVRVGATGLVRVDAALLRPRANPWPWLGPTIGVVAAAGLSVIGYFVIDAARPTGDVLAPSDAWGTLR